jgi:hypothetical protein
VNTPRMFRYPSGGAGSIYVESVPKRDHLGTETELIWVTLVSFVIT